MPQLRVQFLVGAKFLFSATCALSGGIQWNLVNWVNYQSSRVLRIPAPNLINILSRIGLHRENYIQKKVHWIWDIPVTLVGITGIVGRGYSHRGVSHHVAVLSQVLLVLQVVTYTEKTILHTTSVPFTIYLWNCVPLCDHLVNPPPTPLQESDQNRWGSVKYSILLKEGFIWLFVMFLDLFRPHWSWQNVFIWIGFYVAIAWYFFFHFKVGYILITTE